MDDTNILNMKNQWEDLPSYIIDITKEIWEGRNIASLDQYYAEDIIVRTPAGISQGRENVVTATLATLAEFPNRTLFAEDVICSGSTKENMYSSHRIITTASHLNPGAFSQQTGQKLFYRTIADCHATNYVIDDEWLIRDNGALVRQLGWNPEEYARELIQREGGRDAASLPFYTAIDIQGSYADKGNTNEWGERLSYILKEIMRANFTIITKEYDRAAIEEYPGAVSGISYECADDFWMKLRAAFPSATFQIEHQIGYESPMFPPRAAIRWFLQGKHEGWGAFGQPTGAPVFIMGITHAEFGPWGLRREYTLFDETMIWKQICLHKG